MSREGCKMCGKDNPCNKSWCPFEEKEVTKTLDEWVGENALGLGSGISVTLGMFGVEKENREDCLRVIMTVIRQWDEEKKK